MKQLFLFVLAIFSLTASAQGLLNRNRLNRSSQKYQPLVELMPFTNAVAKAKAGDGAGFFALAIYVSKGEEVQKDGKLAYKYLCAAADAGDANAIFVKHLLEERTTKDGYDRARNLDSYIGRCTFDCTNRFCEGNIDVGQRDVAEKLLAQYRADFERGVAAATNEIARIEAEIKHREDEAKRIEDSKEQERIADEQKKKSEEKRKRNAEILASEIGDKVVSEEQVRPRLLGGHQTFYSRRMQERQQMQEKEAKKFAKEEKTRAEFGAVREEQRNQIMQIQNELRKVREARGLKNEDKWTDPNTSITWTYTVTNAEVCVTSVNSTTNSITIPSSIGGCPVTSIGGTVLGVFWMCRELASVTIPSSLTSIGRYAFSGCSGLKSVTIPEGVTNIEYYAFYNCSGLKSMAIPSHVMSIGRGAFHRCSGLMTVVVAEDNPNYKAVNGLLLSKDGTTLVQGINGDVIIPSSVMSIGKEAFLDCCALTSVTIPSSVMRIGSKAFSGCSELRSVTIPKSVVSIGDDAFERCSGLTHVYVDAGDIARVRPLCDWKENITFVEGHAK